MSKSWKKLVVKAGCFDVYRSLSYKYTVQICPSILPPGILHALGRVQLPKLCYPRLVVHSPYGKLRDQDKYAACTMRPQLSLPSLFSFDKMTIMNRHAVSLTSGLSKSLKTLCEVWSMELCTNSHEKAINSDVANVPYHPEALVAYSRQIMSVFQGHMRSKLGKSQDALYVRYTN